MRTLLIGVMALAAIGFCGCGAGPETVTFTTVGEEFSAGGEVTVVLRNGSMEKVQYTLFFCPLRLERESSAGVFEPAACAEASKETFCLTSLNHVRPFAEVTETFPLPAECTSGTYRFRSDVGFGGPDAMDERFDVVTPPFVIRNEG